MATRNCQAELVSSPLKYHGGKNHLASWVVANLNVKHTNYVEPYAGGLSVLLHKDPSGISEVINDLDGRLTNFWDCLKIPTLFEEFRRRIGATPFSQVEWQRAKMLLENGQGDQIEKAAAFFILCRQSLAGRQQGFTPISTSRTRRGQNEQTSAWMSAVQELPRVHERLMRVAILNKPALDVIRQFDRPETLFYLDPPYLPETRTSPTVYRYEMTKDDHIELLTTLQSVKGKVAISGYPSTLYTTKLASWNQVTRPTTKHSAQAAETTDEKPSPKSRAVEVLWRNF